MLDQGLFEGPQFRAAGKPPRRPFLWQCAVANGAFLETAQSPLLAQVGSETIFQGRRRATSAFPGRGATMDSAVTAAIEMFHQGDPSGARVRLLELWARSGADPAARCAIAHFLADTEAKIADELAWDLRALEAATGGTAGEDRDPRTPDLAGFLPSLHLNVGDAYRRAGDVVMAERHARHGIARSDALAGDGYGATVRQALDRLLARVVSEHAG